MWRARSAIASLPPSRGMMGASPLLRVSAAPLILRPQSAALAHPLLYAPLPGRREHEFHSLRAAFPFLMREDGAVKALEDKKKALGQEDKLSKVEMAVQVSKSKKEEEEEEEQLPPVPAGKKSLWVRFKEGLHHYWVGSKLLALDIRISARLVTHILKGRELTRRERKQLLRTTSDLFRLVPFVVLLIIPFAEFALPILLKFFPNMLPSTFEDKYEREEKKKKLLQARVETARFLQETLEEMALVSEKPDNARLSEAFSEFFKKIRNTGQQAANKDILLFSKFFKDELTLDNLTRPQIVSMCKYMGVNAFGTSPFLRSQLRKRFKELKEDDMMIQKEGVDSLNVMELQQACQSRGMRTIGISSKRLRSELQQWIDLRLVEGVPGSLMVLARAMMIQDRVTEQTNENISSALQAALSSLPDEVVKEVEMDVSEIQGKSENAKKLDLIREQEELIREEQEEHEAAAQPISLQQRIENAHARAATIHGDKEAEGDLVKEIRSLRQEQLSTEQIASLSDAVNMLSSSSFVMEEREELEKLKTDHKEYVEGVEGLKGVPELTVSKASTRLSQGLTKMIEKIDEEMKQIEKEGNASQLINPDLGGEITFEDVEKALTIIKNRPQNPESLRSFLSMLDKDMDGRISIQELEKYADSLEEMEGVGEVEAQPRK